MKSEMSHMELHPAENGGVMVKHHMKPKMSKGGGMTSYEEPKVHIFTKEDAMGFHEHIAEHTGMPMVEHDQAEEPEGDEY